MMETQEAKRISNLIRPNRWTNKALPKNFDLEIGLSYLRLSNLKIGSSNLTIDVILYVESDDHDPI